MSGRDESRAGSTAPGTATPAPRTAPDAESSPAPASPAGPRARLRRTFRKAARAARRLRTSLLTRCVACVLAYAAVLVGLSHVASPKNNQSAFGMINLNCEEDAVEIDWNQDTSDAGDHLNLRGAQKVTTAVGALLAQRYGLASHAGDRAYTAWDDAYARYTQQVTALQWTAGTATDATPVAQRQAPRPSRPAPAATPPFGVARILLGVAQILSGVLLFLFGMVVILAQSANPGKTSLRTTPDANQTTPNRK